ncbi:hypothetical protein GPJ56_008770 [Histomonas meleagridis]|uniref:uncharacterized protein n=1 Tax=Histomonas meleagridis TaxID=135588 RepID=UPI00355A1DE4|nr:hypothetical protein GPJ56_008770 [Histomonas meleagridis]KAH0805439.1 hypothetical protein GO595_001821 [Histomonas meleagridis]
MPTWSNGYHRCDSKDSEVSCYELSRAARLIEQWENNSIQKRHIGKVIVKVTKAPFIERLTMLYHGLQIAISTNRDLYTDRNLFLPIELPSVIMQRTGRESGKGLPSDHYVCCCDVSPRYPNVFINGYSWPQAFYVHHDIAPFLRGNFGYHAAYFLGNYLFGNSTKPPNKCFHDTTSTIIEGYQSQGTDSELKPCNFFYTLPRCGIDPSQASMIANENCSQKHFKETFWYNVDDPNQNVCALRKLTSAKRIVQTFGSRLGFWATALQGSKGSFVNTVDKICVNMTNSQQGSLWHTYCPNNKKDVFKTNSYFFICGPNAEDGRLYLDYLLW